MPMYSGGGFIGRGVEVTNVVRVYDEFRKSVLSAETMQGYLQGMQAQLNVLMASSPTLPSACRLPCRIFQGVQNATSNPASVPSRQQLISLANTMVGRYQQLNDRLQEVRSSVNGEIETVVSQINAIASRLADLNSQITLASGTGKRLMICWISAIRSLKISINWSR